MTLKQLVVGPLQTNCYILIDDNSGQGIIIDAGAEATRIVQAVRNMGVSVKAIVATHAHFDHIMAVEEVKAFTGAPFYMHRDDLTILRAAKEMGSALIGGNIIMPKVDGFIDEGDVLSVGGSSLRVLHTPGHTPGSISLVGEGFVFTGDTLFSGSIGRTDQPGGDYFSIISSIKEKLFGLPDDTVVYPGHGPESTIGYERLINPFVGELGRRSKIP